VTILVPPAAFLPSTFRLQLVANTQSGGRSPFDGTEQRLELPGARWTASLAWEGLTQAEGRALLAFLAQLRGRAGRFRWWPPLPRRATGTASNCQVDGAGQLGVSINLKGFAAGQAFLAGDLFGFSDPAGRLALHMATADVTAGANGLVAVPLAPQIRRSPNNNAAVTLAQPEAIWALATDQAGLDIASGLIAGGSIEIEEVLV
jgi:hypothetical protein